MLLVTVRTTVVEREAANPCRQRSTGRRHRGGQSVQLPVAARPLRVDDYASLLDSIRRSIGTRQLITLPYDWRLSNRHAAQRLQRIGLDALKRWRAESGNADAKLWLVCHSMGGLVARYFCESLGGAADTRALITIGTPHRGSVRALEALVNGKRFGPIDLSRIVRSLPSMYELLPLFPVVRQRTGESFELKRVAAVRTGPGDGKRCT